MKQIIQFNLPDDQYELDLHNNVGKYVCTLIAVAEELRRQLKYEHHSDETHEALFKIRQMICHPEIQI